MEDELIHEQCAAYALGALDPEDELVFETHLATCPRCRLELAGLAQAAGMLAYAVPAAGPPPDLRARILDAARRERPNVVPLRPGRSRVTLALASGAAAAACVAVGLGIWAVSLHEKLGSTTAALHAGPLRAVRLHGAAGSLVVARGGEATLVVSGLEPAPAGKTYEAWVIRGGRAAPAGLFAARHGTAIVHLTGRVRSGAVVGVTLERAGGVAQPSASPIVTSALT
jgi:anti-sigma factor RsiW